MTPLSVPLDKNKLFPNELTSGDNGECVGFTIADIIGNTIGSPCDVAFSYAAGLQVSGETPTTNGEDPAAAVAAAVVFGALPVLQEGTTPEPQLYEANFANYSPSQKAFAQKYAQNGSMSLANYTAIANYVLQYQQGAIIAVRWYQSFNDNVQNGVLPLPQAGEQPVSNHCIACYGSTPQGLIIKSWQGNVGLGGYLIMPLSVFNACFVEAYGFVPSAWKWLSLVKIALQYTNMITTILPLLNS